MFLLIAAIQHEELVGYCYKKGDIPTVASEKVKIGFVDSKENCLKQCLLKEGAKGCQLTVQGNKKFCAAIITSFDSSDGTNSRITCWKFTTEEGKSHTDKTKFN